jgi:hypothetical protein
MLNETTTKTLRPLLSLSTTNIARGRDDHKTVVRQKKPISSVKITGSKPNASRRRSSVPRRPKNRSIMRKKTSEGRCRLIPSRTCRSPPVEKGEAALGLRSSSELTHPRPHPAKRCTHDPTQEGSTAAGSSSSERAGGGDWLDWGRHTSGRGGAVARCGLHVCSGAPEWREEGSSTAPSLAGMLPIFSGIYEDSSGEGMVATNRSGQASTRRIFIGCGGDVHGRRERDGPHARREDELQGRKLAA